MREAPMKHLKVILIITALLSNYLIYNAENAIATNENINEALIESKENRESKENTEKIAEPSEIEQWNNHLELLTIQGEYWDAHNNVPNDSWEKDAFNLAEKV